MRNHGFVPTLEVLGTIARRSSCVAGPTGRGRGGGTPARSSTTWGGLRGKRVQGVSAFGHCQVEVDVAHVVVLRERGILLVTIDGRTAFDGPYPLGITGRQIHLTAPPIRATRAYLVVSTSANCSHIATEEERRRGEGVHRTFAVILPSAIPDPSSKDTCASLLKSGSTSPTPKRGDRVTFFPLASA